MENNTDQLPDIQKSGDTRNVAIEKVGISGLKYPVKVLDRNKGAQNTVATIAMSVGLPADVKGTHMSRFIEVLSLYSETLSSQNLPELVKAIKDRLDANSAHVEINFPYFIEKAAPVTKKTALMDVECSLSASCDDDVTIGLSIPIASLCPCSKEISDYGAHNQRGQVELFLKTTNSPNDDSPAIWFEEVIEWVEDSASAPLYPLLKRPDERFVTMQAYDNPNFVEDIVRNVAVRLKADERIAYFKATVTNFESIHNHNAFAFVEWSR